MRSRHGDGKDGEVREDNPSTRVRRSMGSASRVLVTGGAGFIGSALAAALARRGASVCVLDDLSGGARQPHDGAVDFVRASVLDAAAVAAAMDGCTHVCHLAAVVGVLRVVRDPQATLRVNTAGTRIVALEAARRGVALVLASSSEVYGPGAARAMHEDDPPLVGAGGSSRWSYALSKLAGEWLVRDLCNAGQLDAVVVRFFNTTGARQSPESGMVLPSMVARALSQEPIVVHGDGRQVRSFCDVSDTVRALELLLEKDVFDGRVYNVGSPTPVAILELARSIAQRTGASIRHVPHTDAFGPCFEDVGFRVPDIGRLERRVGFAPRVGLEELIDATLEHARQRLEVAALP